MSRIRVIRIIHDIAFTDCCTPSSHPAVSIVSIIFFCFINSFRHGCLSADRAVIAVDVRQIFLTEVLDARLHRNSGRMSQTTQGSQAHRLRQLIDFFQIRQSRQPPADAGNQIVKLLAALAARCTFSA